MHTCLQNLNVQCLLIFQSDLLPEIIGKTIQLPILTCKGTHFKVSTKGHQRPLYAQMRMNELEIEGHQGHSRGTGGNDHDGLPVIQALILD